MKSLKDDVSVTGERPEIEDLVETDATDDLAIAAHQHSEVEALVPCAHGMTLDGAIGGVSVEARLDEGQQ